MDSLKKQIAEQLKLINDACTRVKLPELIEKLESLTAQTTAPGFWGDAQKAGAVMKEQATIQARTDPWINLQKEAKDLSEMAYLDDQSMQVELEQQLEKLTEKFDELKGEESVSVPQRLWLLRPRRHRRPWHH